LAEWVGNVPVNVDDGGGTWAIPAFVAAKVRPAKDAMVPGITDQEIVAGVQLVISAIALKENASARDDEMRFPMLATRRTRAR
jgi:hypothetical protein